MNAYSPKFQRCIQFVVREEGGFVNDPKDPGGATKYGISMRSHRTDIGDLDRDGDIDADDVKLLTVDQAIDIYADEYWSGIRGEELPEPMALALLDTAVNCGIGRAIRLLQRAVGLKEDGIFGPATLSQAKTFGSATKLLQERRRFYRSLPGFARYGNGWTARVSRLAFAMDAAMRREVSAR